ncbi:MAG: D-amino-acid transaminase [Chloroflexota bacterium]
MAETIWLNGKYYDNMDEARVTIEDRGMLFGDGIYEVIRIYDGKPFLLAEHMDRLLRSAAGIELPLPMAKDEIAAVVREVIERAAIPEATIYIEVTRGGGPRFQGWPADPKPNMYMWVKPVAPGLDEQRKVGAKAITHPDQRWLRCDLKTVNLLANTMARAKARSEGAYEAILYRENGIVTEASAASAFMVKGGVLYAHPLDNLVLPGITRWFVTGLAKKLGYQVVEKTFTVDELRQADEIFLTGTQTEVMPIIKLDDGIVADGKVGPVTAKIQEAFKKAIRG